MFWSDLVEIKNQIEGRKFAHPFAIGQVDECTIPNFVPTKHAVPSCCLTNMAAAAKTRLNAFPIENIAILFPWY
jgi:hypothetical protein